MKTEKPKAATKQKGLTDKQLVEKYEVGKIDLVGALKKGIVVTQETTKITQPEKISKN